MHLVFKKLAEIEKKNLFSYADYVFNKIAGIDEPEELDEINNEIDSDLSDNEIKNEKQKQSRICL